MIEFYSFICTTVFTARSAALCMWGGPRPRHEPSTSDLDVGTLGLCCKTAGSAPTTISPHYISALSVSASCSPPASLRLPAGRLWGQPVPAVPGARD